MRLLHRVPNDDRGFTLVEAMVSLVIIFGLMVVLLRTFDSGTRVIVETRKQAVASAFASELIERGQALEWEHMGLATSTRAKIYDGTATQRCNQFYSFSSSSAFSPIRSLGWVTVLADCSAGKQVRLCQHPTDS